MCVCLVHRQVFVHVRACVCMRLCVRVCLRPCVHLARGVERTVVASWHLILQNQGKRTNKAGSFCTVSKRKGVENRPIKAI